MRNQPKQVSLTDDSQSLDATEFVWNSEDDVSAHNYILPTVLRRLQSSSAKRILDLGCGNGSMTRALIKAGFTVVGIDPSISGIEHAQRGGVGEYRCLSVDEPLPPDMVGRFDAVVSTEVIEHLLLPRNLFHRAKEATQGNRGFLVVSTPYHGYLKNLAIALCNKFDVHTADEFFNSVGISKIDYLKMDIEGFEVHALKGLKDTLQRHRPVCFIEWTQNSREQGLTNGIDLFPQDYIFYRFVAFRPFMLFFNLKGYQLVRLTEDWTDGNLVAVPREYAEQVTLLKPTCIVARRLKGD